LGYIFVAEGLGISSTTYAVCPESYQIRWNNTK